jgi:hypothetical protein
MIIYRPSIGNTTSQVNINSTGNWLGKSLGGAIVKERSMTTFPFDKVDSKLISSSEVLPGQQSSNWFYNSITDFDFIKGATTYRCIYIGCEADSGVDSSNFLEYIDEIPSFVNFTTPTNIPIGMSISEANALLTNSVTLSLWYEGKFNIQSSKNSFVISDELDQLNELSDLVTASGRSWQQTLSYNDYLKPGEYLKVWIKRECSDDKSLVNIFGYSYSFGLNDLVISNIERNSGRLNVSKVYTGNLNDSVELKLKELIPIQATYKEIFQIIDKNGFTNIFYIDESNKIHDLIIKSFQDSSQNKFIDYDFSTITQSISSNSEYAFSRVTECLNGNIQLFGEIKNELVPYLHTKFITSIISSNKDDITNCYIFYNELLPNSNDSNYEKKYNHINYSWNFGVIKVDLSFSTESEFSSISPGYANRKTISLLDTTSTFVLKQDYFASSVILQDDLFTIVGYEIEDCKIENKKSFVNYLWESDIVYNTPKLTTTFIPHTESTKLLTVKNEGNIDSYLVINDLSKISKNDFNSKRQIKSLNDGNQYLQLASPHEREIKMGSSSASIDMASVNDDVSYTIAFNIDEASIQSSNTTSIVGSTTFDDNYATHKHLLLDNIYKKYTEFTPVYRDDQQVSYTTQKIRQDGIQIQNVNPFGEVIPLTGNDFTHDVLANLHEILPTSDIVRYSTDFGQIVKLSGDGNTALIIVKNYVYVNEIGISVYNVPTSRVFVYKRCGIQWAYITEIKPSPHDIFNLDVFFEITDAEKIDISHDGSFVVISSRATSTEVGNSQSFGKQFDYTGYIIRIYNTLNDWNTYSQQVLSSNDILPSDQKTYLSGVDYLGNTTTNFEFGSSVSLSDDGSFLLIGSPNEYYNYKKYDNKGALLDQFNLSDNGAIYMITTRPLTSINVVDISASLGLTFNDDLWNPILDLNQDGIIDDEDIALAQQSISQRDYIYGDTISGSNWNFIARLIPHDSYDTINGGLSYKECLANGLVGKRYGEKVRVSSDASILATSAKNDSQAYLKSGAVYSYNIPLFNTQCIFTSQLKTIKLIPNSAYANMVFSSASLDLSKDGSTIVVGCPNESNGSGIVHIFNELDWVESVSHSEIIVSDPESSNGNFGMDVKLNVDSRLMYVKNSMNIKQFEFNQYTRRYFEFNKIEKSKMSGGTSFDINADGNSLIIGCVREVITDDNRVFIYDEYPQIQQTVSSLNCPPTGTPGTTGTSGTSGTSGTPDPYIISDLYSIPIFYLTEVNYIPNYYVVKVLIDELLPQTVIGLETQSKQFIDSSIGICKLHCNGNPDIYALDIAYNPYQQEWILNYFNNKAQQITVIIAQSNILISPNYTNVITINTTRTQVNGYYCGKRYAVSYEVCVNGRKLYGDVSYTFDTTNTYTLTYNQNSSFTSALNYMEVREYLDDITLYNKTLSIIYSNVYWPNLGNETDNIMPNKGFEQFLFKRQLTLNNIPWDNAKSIVVPIVLQGNAYNVSSTYNTQIRRNIFDFNKLDISKPSFAFCYEGVGSPLKWSIDPYDSNKDTITIWVKLEEWTGQKISMYYGDLNYIQSSMEMNPFEDHLSAWKMNELLTINRLRYDDAKVFNGGEALIVSRNSEKTYVTQINKQYMLGNMVLYKSNKFDICYDDAKVDRSRSESVENFIRTNVKQFSPAFMKIRNVQSKNELLVESNSSVGESHGN